MAASLGLVVEELDPFSGQLIRVAGSSGAALFGGGPLCAFPVNNATAVSIARDKTHTLQVLAAGGIRCVEGEYVFLRGEAKMQRPGGRERDSALDMAQRLGFPLIVKPNSASRGRSVFRVESPEELADALSAVAGVDAIARIERCLTGTEYRLLVFDGRVRYGFGKSALRVAGDGHSTLAQLLADLKVGTATMETLSAGQDLQAVPALGQDILLSVAANVAAGGRVHDFATSIPECIHAFAARVAAVMNLRLAGIDVFAPRWEAISDSGVVLEVNGNPSLGTAAQRFPPVVDALWQEILLEVTGG